MTFEVNLPTNLGELTFKNTSKWVIDHVGVVRGSSKCMKRLVGSWSRVECVRFSKGCTMLIRD